MPNSVTKYLSRISFQKHAADEKSMIKKRKKKKQYLKFKKHFKK